jgi:hypothetical protein
MRRTDLGIASMNSRCTTHTMIDSDVLFNPRIPSSLLSLCLAIDVIVQAGGESRYA